MEKNECVVWCVSIVSTAVLLLVLVLTIVSSNTNYWNRQHDVDKAAIQNGYCQEQNVGDRNNLNYHWTKCK